MGAGESKGAGDGGSPEQGSLSFSEESLPTLQQAWDKEACITYSACDLHCKCTVAAHPLTSGCASAVQRNELAELPEKWVDLTHGCCAPRSKNDDPPGQTPRDLR